MKIKIPSIPKAASRLEMGVCFGSLLLLALIPFTELALRQFKAAIPASRLIVTHLFLVVGFFAAMLTAKTGAHITITTVQFIKNERIKHVLQFISSLLLIFIVSVLAWNSLSFIKYDHRRIIGLLPNWVFAAAMPIGFLAIALRFALRLERKREKIIAFLTILLGAAAAMPAIVKIIWGMEGDAGFAPPQILYNLVNGLYDAASLIQVPAALFLIAAAFFGLPIFAAIGGIALIMLMAAGLEPEAVPIEIFSALTNADLIAIPLFTLTGFFLSESKAGERLVRVFRVFLGWLPGGMVIAAVLICAFFTSFTGASGVTILALGGILHKILTENKYSERASIGLLTSAGGAGLMFPPSLPIILVASTSGIILHWMNEPITYSIVHYFLGAIIPGILLVLTMIIAGIVLSSKIKTSVKFDSKEALPSLKESFFELLLPVILIGGYFSGLLSLLEISAMSVVYVVIVEVFIKKDIAFGDIPKVFSKAVPIIGGVLMILAMAKALSYAIIDTGVPERFVDWMQMAVQSKFVFLLLLNIALLIVGCLMDIFSAILVVLPLVIPLGVAYGIDPVHLGIIFIVNLEAGFLTPPVGLNLFLASYRFEKPFVSICRNVLPFIAIRLVIVLLVTYIPALSTWLAGLFP